MLLFTCSSPPNHFQIGQFWYWEVIETMRRLVLTMGVAIISTRAAVQVSQQSMNAVAMNRLDVLLILQY